jgi:hypothetical protein
MPDSRKFIRHPVDIPIEVSVDADDLPGPQQSYNVSLGGLALRARQGVPPGTLVRLRIACVRPVFESRARVVWCRPANGCHELGVEFLDADALFRARMVEQVCHIEDYRNRMLRAGRELSPTEAAMEWIAEHAAEFPGA